MKDNYYDKDIDEDVKELMRAATVIVQSLVGQVSNVYAAKVRLQQAVEILSAPDDTWFYVGKHD